MPSMATFNNAPDNIADTGAGPSLWASGNQVCIGANPTFVPNPTNTNKNASSMSVVFILGAISFNTDQVS